MCDAERLVLFVNTAMKSLSELHSRFATLLRIRPTERDVGSPYSTTHALLKVEVTRDTEISLERRISIFYTVFLFVF